MTFAPPATLIESIDAELDKVRDRLKSDVARHDRLWQLRDLAEHHQRRLGVVFGPDDELARAVERDPIESARLASLAEGLLSRTERSITT